MCWQLQWLKWKIRGEGTVYQLWAKMGPNKWFGTLFMKFKVWERWISITGGAGLRSLASNDTLTTGQLSIMSTLSKLITLRCRGFLRKQRVSAIMNLVNFEFASWPLQHSRTPRASV